jgi:hypothetical protein
MILVLIINIIIISVTHFLRLYRSRWPLHFSLFNESPQNISVNIFLNSEKYKTISLKANETVKVTFEDVRNPITGKRYTRDQVKNVTIQLQLNEDEDLEENDAITGGFIRFDKGNIPDSTIIFSHNLSGIKGNVDDLIWDKYGYYIMDFDNGIPLF